MLRETITENGAVRGLPGTDARITVYKGIPYAAPPVGKNRWRAPQPADNWQGMRECFEFGPINMQRTPGVDPEAFYSREWHVDPKIPMSEDSLYLNIWTPAKPADEKLPVMIWIFGGGFQEGYSYEMEFDGERIASRGVILVSIGYRLNAFGFLSHPDLSREDPEHPTNFGLLDQLFAFRWVQRNIANFGGDPENLTIFGQSAGGDAVYAHLCSPQSRGAFQKAIVESNGAFTYQYPKTFLTRVRPTLPEAEEKGERFLREALGVDTIEEARKLDAAFIESKQLEWGLFAIPVVDQKFLLRDMPQSVIKNELQDIPFLIGNTTGEFMVGPEGDSPEEVLAWAKENFGDRGQEYFDIVCREAQESGKTLREAATISSFQLGAQLAVETLSRNGRRPWYYRFGPTIPGDDAGAYHSCDLWFEFETLIRCWRPFDGHHFDLARRMCNYWTNFAKTGDPNGTDPAGLPMPEWKPYSPEEKNEIRFLDEISVSTEQSEKRRFLIDINIGS
ncbi:MAG: carboxylesterase family protein [Lachnospiraceae bacterium]|nr:carboxylesterase family protein [Lachnospiraceae bacterium]